MNPSTAYNHYKRIGDRIRSIHSTTRASCRSCEDHIKEISDEAWQDEAFRKLPRHYQSALHELEHTLFDDIQLHWIIWMFINSKGEQVFFENLNEEERGDLLKENKSGKHYWLRLKYVGGKTTRCDLSTMTLTREYEMTNREW